MLGLNRRFDRIQGRRPRLIRRKPIIKTLCATVGFSDVTSANVVGYNTINLTKEYSLFTVNFTKTDGTALTVQEAVPPTEGMTLAKTTAAADQIQVMDSEGTYNSSYYLSNGEYGKGKYNPAASNKWVLTSKANSPTPTEDTLPVGSTFFYVSRGAKAGNPHSVQMAGGVDLNPSETFTINKAYTLIGCPFPTDVAINGGIQVTGSTEAKTTAAADQIQIMDDAGTYNSSYYLSNGEYGKGKYNPVASNKWVLTSKANSPVPTEDPFPCGKGAFYVSRKCDGTVTFINPIKK